MWVDADFEPRFTIGWGPCDAGAFAGCAGAGASAAAVTGAATVGADAFATCVVTFRVTVLVATVVFVATVAGFIVRAAVRFGLAETGFDGAATVVPLSVTIGAVSSVVGGAVGAGAGTGSGGTGWASWASSGVEESARAAAIAGRALVRACWMVFLIIGKNGRYHACDARLSPIGGAWETI
jgi:hypothetical protein